MTEKFLLTDIDDSVLCWRSKFKKFAENQLGRQIHGEPTQFKLSSWLSTSDKETNELVREFNDYHEDFGNLTPCFDAEIFLPRLKSCGYTLIGISACSDKPKTLVKRRQNLYDVFGDIFAEVFCVDTSSGKREILSQYKPSIWVEDHYDNGQMGSNLGHNTFMFRQPYNKQYEDQNHNLTFIDSWLHIYDIIK